MQITSVEQQQGCERLKMVAVCRTGGYPADGSDEDNTFAKWSPSAELAITITNPALHGKFKPGEKYYVDFTPAPIPFTPTPEPAATG